MQPPAHLIAQVATYLPPLLGFGLIHRKELDHSKWDSGDTRAKYDYPEACVPQMLQFEESTTANQKHHRRPSHVECVEVKQT